MIFFFFAHSVSAKEKEELRERGKGRKSVLKERKKWEERAASPTLPAMVGRSEKWQTVEFSIGTGSH